MQVMVTLLEPLHEGGAVATAAARVVEAIVVQGGQQFKVNASSDVNVQKLHCNLVAIQDTVKTQHRQDKTLSHLSNHRLSREFCSLAGSAEAAAAAANVGAGTGCRQCCSGKGARRPAGN